MKLNKVKCALIITVSEYEKIWYTIGVVLRFGKDGRKLLVVKTNRYLTLSRWRFLSYRH